MTMTKQELIAKTTEWAEERELHTGPYQLQVLKMAEEMGELIGAHLKLRKGPSEHWRQVQMDSVGDMLIVMGVLWSILKNQAPDYASWNEEAFDGDINKKTFLPGRTSEYILNDVMHYCDVAFGSFSNARISVRNLWSSLQRYCINEGLDILECWELAYNEVSQRKGKTVGGVFIKEGD